MRRSYFYRAYAKGLIISQAQAPPGRERGKLLAAENLKKIRQAARSLDTPRWIDIQRKNNKN